MVFVLSSTATYAKTTVITHKITVTQPAEGGAIAPRGTVPVRDGKDKLFTITPKPGYHVTSIVADTGDVTGSATIKGKVYKYPFIEVTADTHTITAAFAKDTFTLTVNISGTDSATGTVVADSGTLTCSDTSCTGTYEYGNKVILTQTPGSNSDIKSWTGCQPDSKKKTCAVTLKKNTTVGAKFKKQAVVKGKITLTGSVGAQAVAAPGAAYTLSANKVDKIIAIQSERGNLNENSMLYSKSAAVNTDGTFSISLDTKQDWLLMLMDSTAATKADQFVGYIALNPGAGLSLMQVPATASYVSSLDLGTVTASGDTWQSEKTISNADFSLTQQQLLDLANNDDTFKSVKNFVINYDDASNVYYTLRPDFKWIGSYSGIDGAFQKPDEYTYRHYQFQLDSNTTSVTMSKICGSNGQAKMEVKLSPPSDVQTRSDQMPVVTYNAGNPMSSANATCATATDKFIEAGGNAFYATNRYGGVSQSYYAALSGVIPAGYWLYYEGDQLKGQFDVAVASPITSDNRVRGFIPSIRVNKDGAGKITSVDIKWYSWDSSANEYVELTDISILKYLVGSGDVYFDNTTDNTRTYESVHFDPAVQKSITPSKYTWYFGTAGTQNLQVQGIGIFYNSGGTGYFFEFFR